MISKRAIRVQKDYTHISFDKVRREELHEMLEKLALYGNIFAQILTTGQINRIDCQERGGLINKDDNALSFWMYLTCVKMITRAQENRARFIHIRHIINDIDTPMTLS